MVWKNFLFTAAIAVVVTITMTWVGLLVINALLVLPGAPPGTWLGPASVPPGLRPGRVVWRHRRADSLLLPGTSTGASITLLLALWFFLTLLLKRTR